VTEETFHCEAESSVENNIKTTTVHCHGKLISASAEEVKKIVKPLIPQGGVIVIDLADVSFMDSMGLGGLVALKVSAINEGYVTLKLVNVAPRLQDLLTLTNLKSLFAS
jgi:anti-anti-sigma factor